MSVLPQYSPEQPLYSVYYNGNIQPNPCPRSGSGPIMSVTTVGSAVRPGLEDTELGGSGDSGSTTGRTFLRLKDPSSPVGSPLFVWLVTTKSVVCRASPSFVAIMKSTHSPSFKLCVWSGSITRKTSRYCFCVIGTLTRRSAANNSDREINPLLSTARAGNRRFFCR